MVMTGSVPMAGTGFGGEVLVGGAYQVAPGVSAGLDVGYRLLKVSKMKATKDLDFDNDGVIDVKKNDVYEDANNKAIPFDLGGLIAVAKVNYSF
jgi:hypothetical protein